MLGLPGPDLYHVVTNSISQHTFLQEKNSVAISRCQLLKSACEFASRPESPLDYKRNVVVSGDIEMQLKLPEFSTIVSAWSRL